MQDLLSDNGKFLSLDEFKKKFGLKVNYLQYFKITAAIQSSLKQTAMQTPISAESLFSTPDLLYLSEESTLSLSKMRCKHYYKLFNECSVSEPTGIKKWKEHFPNSFLDWRRNFTRIYQITKDNKLRQFLFKVLHRIIITKKELKTFNIETDNHCNFCPRPDSIMHTFLECDVSISLFSSTIKWFNDVHKLNVSPSVEQILFNSTDEIASLTSIQKRRLDLLLLLMKHYLYSCKVFCKNPNIFELQTKLQLQWKIEHCSLSPCFHERGLLRLLLTAVL